MARPPKLTIKQIEELQDRRIKGESVKSLAISFKVSPSTVKNIVGGKTLVSVKPITKKNLANQLAAIESEIENLPVSDQADIRLLTDNLKGISNSLSDAALSGSNTAARLSKIAERHSFDVEDKVTVDGKDIIKLNHESLKTAMMVSQVANEAAKIPLNLLAANKEIIKEMNDKNKQFEDIPTDLGFLYGE